MVKKVDVKDDDKFLPATVDNNTLPAHLSAGKTVKLGNIDQTDLIMPRIKLLQGVSPEVTDFDDAKAGHFWHSLAGQDLGETLDFITITIRKSVVLWAPRGDERGILARSSDCIHWDVGANERFEVKFQKDPNKYVWETGSSVRESGLLEFGSSKSNDSNSQPAAALTYSILAYFPRLEGMHLGVLLNSRSSAKKGKLLVSKIEFANVDHYGLKFSVTPTLEKSDGQSYYNYNYARNGFADADDYENCKKLYEKFADNVAWRSNDEEDARPDATATGPSTSDKF